MGIVFNHEKLKNRINAMYGDMVIFGKELGMSKQRVNSRLVGVTEFTLDEIEKAVDRLHIAPDEIAMYFFDVGVI